MSPLPPQVLEALFARSGRMLAVLDPRGTVLAANPAALATLGQGAGEVLGRPLGEAPWLAADPAARAQVQAALAGGALRLEAGPPGRVVDLVLTPLEDPPGDRRWVLLEGRDITHEQQAEAALREREEKYRQIFQCSQDGILLLDGDRFVDCNPAVLAMMGCSGPDLLRMHPWDLSPPFQPDGRPSPEKAREMIALAHANGGHRFEWVHRRAGGEDFPVEVSLMPFSLAGRPVLCTTWREVAGRKREERERLDLERRVLHAQKLESLGILAGGIAHDFNNLMTAMMGRLELAQQEFPEAHGALEHLRVMSGILDRAADLTRQMLAYSGKGRFVVGPTDLSAMAGEITRLLASSLSKKVQLELDLAEGLPAVVGDAAQLQQVLLNLVTNASDAIGEQPGRIRVATGVEALDAAALAALRGEDRPGPGTFVFLEVSDTGCGIAPEVRDRIFEPFFSTKETGRGLGLSALLGILRAHRGAFRMDSAPGAGTTFRVYFPAGGPAGPGFLPLGAGSALPPGLRVLLVDDEEHIRDATQRLLAGLGCVVVAAGDGLEALELAASEPFSVVLLDLMMPRMDGSQALALLQEDHPGLPVVLCSGYTAQEIPAAFEGVFLAKPYTLEQLTEALAAALAQGARA